MLVKKDVLVLNGQKLVQGMQVHKQLMLQIMPQRIAAHHLLCLFVQLAIDKDKDIDYTVVTQKRMKEAEHCKELLIGAIEGKIKS